MRDRFARRAAGGAAWPLSYRVGTGVDAHALEPGVPLVLGGVSFRSPRGLAGHSDGDVITHALIDALLGPAGLGDIGTLFPSDDPELKGVSSLKLLREAYAQVRTCGYELVNADVVLIGQEPKIAPVRKQMQVLLAGTLEVDAGPDLGARDDDGRARLHGPRRGARRAGGCVASVLERVAARQHAVGALRERLEGRHVPAERIGQPDDHAEQRADVDRVDERVVRHAGRSDCVGVLACDVGGTQRQLLEETERRAELQARPAPFASRARPRPTRPVRARTTRPRRGRSFRTGTG